MSRFGSYRASVKRWGENSPTIQRLRALLWADTKRKMEVNAQAADAEQRRREAEAAEAVKAVQQRRHHE